VGCIGAGRDLGFGAICGIIGRPDSGRGCRGCTNGEVFRRAARGGGTLGDEVGAAEGATVETLMAHLGGACPPGLWQAGRGSRSTGAMPRVTPGCTTATRWPFSRRSAEARMDDKLFEITAQPISADEVSRRVISPAVGSVVTFTGVVRAQPGAPGVQPGI